MPPPAMKYNPAFLDDETLIRSFVARTAELDRILEVLRENTGESNQHLLIIGPRGIGKTTLVLRAAAETRIDPALGEAWYPIVFGEETYQVSTPGEFWLEALFHVGEQTGEARWRQAYEELLREGDEDRLRARAVAQLMDFADERGKRLLLVVENLNMLIGSQISGNDAWALRQTLMNEPRLMLLGTATSRFEAIDEYNQALYELFRIIELQPLDQEEAQALWASATGQQAPAHQIRPLQILTGGNPRLIRILSEFAAKTSFSTLMDDLTRLVDAHTEYFKHHLDNLPPQERKVFVVLADLWDPSTARKVADTARIDVNLTSALLKRLVDRGAVTAPYKRGRAQFYQVAERMYNIYHLMRRRGPAASRVHAVVRFMVSLYRDEELVQTTRSLVEEASRLAAGQRLEHFIAFEAIVQLAGKARIARKIVERTRSAFESMPDAPPSLLKLLNLDQQPASNGSQNDRERLEADLEACDRALSWNPEDAEAWQKRGVTLSRLDRNDEALESYDRALALNPDDARIWHKRGYVLSKLGRHETALESYDRALTLHPDDARLWNNRGWALSELGRHEAALESCDRALSLNPDNARFWHNRGYELDELGLHEAALESYDRALRLNPDDVDTWLNRGYVLSELGRHEAALESYDRVLTLNPDDFGTWSQRGYVLSKLGRHEAALESHDRALMLNPDVFDMWFNRGYVLSMLGRFESALESYDRELMLNPDDFRIWYNRGNVLGKLGRHEAALESYDRAKTLNPDDARIWHNRGYVLRMLGRQEAALESYDRALTLHPDDARIWNNRGYVLSELGCHAAALESYDRGLTLNPDDAGTWSNRGSALSDLGCHEEALLSHDRALGLDPELVDAWMSKGTALARLGHMQKALECYDRALILDPGSQAGLVARAWINRRLKRLDHAEEDLRQAVALDPRNGPAIRELVTLLFEGNRPDEAMRVAREFIDTGEVSASLLNGLVWDVFIYGGTRQMEEAENWSCRAVEAMDSESGAVRHTYASILGRRGKWMQALEQASLFLKDERMLRDALDDSINFFIEAVAGGQQAGVLKVIEAAGQVETFEPLVVAIQYLSGAEVDVAREISEVAQEVVKRIEERRREISADDA